jgi:hypothetical protein
MRWIALMLALSACAAPPAPPPPDLQACAARVPVPRGLPRVRTVAQIGAYATQVELAREAERRRGDDCADRLARLNDWIERRGR